MIDRTISATEFKARCLELMDEVAERGVRYVVTKRGVPVAELAPVDGPETSPIGFMRGTVLEIGDLIGPEHDVWSASKADPLEEV